MRFESATEDDKEYFRGLNRACYEALVSKQFGAWDDELQQGNFEMKWPEHSFRKIYVDGDLVGGIWIDEDADFNQLREIQIHPQYQGRGIGTRVVKFAIDKAREAGKPIRLRVLFMNRAFALYERLGFVVIGRNEHQYIMECT